MHILVVEDSPMAAKMSKMALERIGCTVTIAQDSEKAVAAFKADPFDFVFMDIGLPDRNGFETTQLIREGEADNTVSYTHLTLPTILRV